MKPRRPCQISSKARGFTLIEVMMVVAILGLILTMGVPSFLRVIRKEGMRKAEYDVVLACKEARRAAIMNNQVTHLIIHPLLGSFEVPGAFPAAQLPDDVRIDILGVNFIQLEKADEADVRFFPNGTSDEFTILLHSGGGQLTEIDLDTIAALPVLKDL
jgi:general secretion pathway protein H